MAVDLKSLPGKCTYNKCKICMIKEGEISCEDSMHSKVSSANDSSRSPKSLNRFSLFS